MNQYTKWTEVPEYLKTKTSWAQEGRSVLRGSEPVAIIETSYCGRRVGCYGLYSHGQTKPKRQCVRRPPKVIDLLAAIWTVTRTAKRYRDAASKSYKKGKHGMAGQCRRRKEQLYLLKDKGIAEAVHLGRISAVGIHGGFCVYRGEGYCFHSALKPIEFDPPEGSVRDDTLTVEAKPKQKEPRLYDAEHTLSTIKSMQVGFERLDYPEYLRKRGYWNSDDPPRQC